MIAATVTCAAVATEASAQDGSIVLNEQLQLGDVIAGQTLNVEDAQDQVTVTTYAQGTYATGAVQNGSVAVTSTQTMSGSARASTVMSLGGDTQGIVNATTQAGGNYLAVGAYDADLDIEAVQILNGTEVRASSAINGGTARLLSGGSVGVSAIGNTTALGGSGSVVTGSVDQYASATVRASNYAATQYSPAEAGFTSQALGNAVAVNSDANSGQNLTVGQITTSNLIEADTSANAGNAWNLAARAHAGANQAVLANQGGSMVVATDQTNGAYVRAAAVATAYDYGSATAYARGAGNEVSAGNNDIYLQIDNTQFNSGGVDVSASFSGTNGYDAYVGADAVGNSVTGYACSECAGQINATNNQVNQGHVTATAQTTVAGSGRAVITGANAVGNSASFYVTRPTCDTDCH